jgi:hypothetical protein
VGGQSIRAIAETITDTSFLALAYTFPFHYSLLLLDRIPQRESSRLFGDDSFQLD